MKKKYSILLLLALIFVCPGLVALALYQHPNWLAKLQTETKNKGRLLENPEKLVLPQSKAKWRFVVWNEGDCLEACRMQVDKIARVRLALGRRLYQVDEVLLLSDKADPLPLDYEAYLKDNAIEVNMLPQEALQNKPIFNKKSQIFIADPNQLLILAYKTNAKSEDLFHDINFLIQADEKKNG